MIMTKKGLLVSILTIATMLSCANSVSDSGEGRPPTPLSVKTTGISMTAIRVSWVRILGAASYTVFRGTADSVVFAFVKTVVADSFVDTGLVIGAMYYYKVNASNAWGNSPDSSVAVAATTGYPGNVATFGISSSSIGVTWISVPGASLYNTYRAISDTGVFALVGSIANDTFVDTGLSSGSSYYYKVSAAKGTQESRLTLPVLGLSIPGSPTLPKIDTVLPGGIRLVWAPDTGAVSLYRIYRNLADTGSFVLFDSTATDTFIDAAAPPGARLFYEVSAANKSGESQKSSFVSALTVPGTPGSVVDTAFSGDSIRLTWVDTPGIVSYYKVYKGASDTASLFTFVDSTVSDTFYDTTSSPTVTAYRISAVDSSGESNRCAAVVFVPPTQPSAAKEKASGKKLRN
jgi:fibronectin type 3 domain-containing protein